MYGDSCSTSLLVEWRRLQSRLRAIFLLPLSQCWVLVSAFCLSLISSLCCLGLEFPLLLTFHCTNVNQFPFETPPALLPLHTVWVAGDSYFVRDPFVAHWSRGIYV